MGRAENCHRFMVNIPEPTFERLRETANGNRETVAAVVNRSILDYLDGNDLRARVEALTKRVETLLERLEADNAKTNEE